MVHGFKFVPFRKSVCLKRLVPFKNIIFPVKNQKNIIVFSKVFYFTKSVSIPHSDTLWVDSICTQLGLGK